MTDPIEPGAWATAESVNAALALRLEKDANLSDLSNPVAARGHLGLAGMAVQNPAAVQITGGYIDGVAIGGNSPVYGQFAQLDMVGDFTAVATGDFWSDDGARVMRINDRLLVGGATANDAAKPNVVKDWLSDLINWPVYNATAAITSSFGTIALTVASQTTDLDPVAAGTTQTTIGVAAFAIANNPGSYPDDYFAAYGFYSEARVYPNTVSDAFAAEFEAINLSGVANATPTPYRELVTGSAQALRLGSGGGQGLDPDPAISALAIVPNGSTFNTGIVFDKAALTGADGTTGFGEAIAMAKGHLVAWYAAGDDGDGIRTLFITSTIADGDNAVSIQAQDGGLLFLQPDGNIGLAISTVAVADNGIAITPAASGSAPALAAIGDGSNPNLALRARMGGRFELTCTTQANAAAGAGGATPSNAAAFLQVTVNNGVSTGNYAIPLYATS